LGSTSAIASAAGVLARFAAFLAGGCFAAGSSPAAAFLAAAFLALDVTVVRGL
jgi:hypothetical protein